MSNVKYINICLSRRQDSRFGARDFQPARPPRPLVWPTLYFVPIVRLWDRCSALRPSGGPLPLCCSVLCCVVCGTLSRLVPSSSSSVSLSVLTDESYILYNAAYVLPAAPSA
jgi:hypothetical protein